MIDITDSMLKFKEAARHTWNAFFVDCENPMSPETQEAFLAIERALLRIMVFSPHGVGGLADSYRSSVLPRVLVKPIYAQGEMPIRFGQKDANMNVAWDVETTIAVDEVTQFKFFDYFDWYPYGQIDLAYIRGREFSRDGESANQRRLVLIEQRYCKFVLEVE